MFVYFQQPVSDSLSPVQQYVVGFDKFAPNRDVDAYTENVAVIDGIWIGVLDFVCRHTGAGTIDVFEISFRLLFNCTLCRAQLLRGLVRGLETRREVGL